MSLDGENRLRLRNHSLHAHLKQRVPSRTFPLTLTSNFIRDT